MEAESESEISIDVTNDADDEKAADAMDVDEPVRGNQSHAHQGNTFASNDDMSFSEDSADGGTPAKSVSWNSRGFGSPEAEFQRIRGASISAKRRLGYGEEEEGEKDASSADEVAIGIAEFEEKMQDEEQVFFWKDSEEEAEEEEGQDDDSAVGFSDGASSEPSESEGVQFSYDSSNDSDQGAEVDLPVDYEPPATKKSDHSYRRAKRKRVRALDTLPRERVLDLPVGTAFLFASPEKEPRSLSGDAGDLPGSPTTVSPRKGGSAKKAPAWEAARARLTHLFAPDNDGNLAGRVAQHEYIKDAVVSFLRTKLGGSMFVYGIPGTGKTATVRLVMNQLVHSGAFDFDYIEINGMKLTTPSMAYSYLWYKLSSNRSDRHRKRTPQLAAEGLVNHFSKASVEDCRPCVLLLDEMDYLLSRDNNIIYNFLDWTHLETSRLYIIGISNTMNLPEQLSQKIRSRLGTLRVAFMPYNASELLEIVQNRLGRYAAELFESPKALELIARTEANSSGDARRLLELCRSILEKLEGLGRKLTTGDIAKYLSRTQENPRVALLRCCSFYSRLLVCCVARETRRGTQPITLAKVLVQIADACANQAIRLPRDGVLRQLLADLAAQRLLIVDTADATPRATIELGIDIDDLPAAVGNDPRTKLLLSPAER